MKNETSDAIELYKLAWEYFAYHASYRLKTFNFFLIASTVITTVNANILTKGEKNYYLFGAMLALYK